MDGPLEVTVDSGTPAAEMAAVEQVFAAAGVPAKVRDDCMRLSADALPFVVMFIAPTTWVAAKFAGGFANKAGEDAWDEFRAGGWRGLTRFLAEIASARGARDGVVTIRDPDGPDLNLKPGIPDAALEDLANLDWTAMSDGWLSWNDARGSWWFLQAHRAPSGMPAPRKRAS
jgi:hypothetical protein